MRLSTVIRKMIGRYVPLLGKADQHLLRMEAPPSPLSSRPKPRISYYAAPPMTTGAAFIEESRMKFADPTKLDRKSGVVEGSAVLSISIRFGSKLRPSLCHPDRVNDCKESRVKFVDLTQPDRKSWDMGGIPE
jgi:hypothetical protein